MINKKRGLPLDPRQDFEPVSPPRVTAGALRIGLEGVGLEPGDLVAAHVSLSSLGRVEGGRGGPRRVVGRAGTRRHPGDAPLRAQC